MLIVTDNSTIDTKWLRCMSNRADGERCETFAGDHGTVHVTADNEGNIKFNVTCGTHVNKIAGDNKRHNLKLDAMAVPNLLNYALVNCE